MAGYLYYCSSTVGEAARGRLGIFDTALHFSVCAKFTCDHANTHTHTYTHINTYMHTHMHTSNERWGAGVETHFQKI